MVGVFACPECGTELELSGLTPGRHVRCPDCDTLVEVPFIPRLGVARRRQAPRSPRVLWTQAAIGLTVVLAVVLVVWQVAHSRWRTQRAGAVAELTASAHAFESAGRLGQALVEIEAALELIRGREAEYANQLDELRRRRDELSWREAEARLAEAERIEDPHRALGEGLTLWKRVESDPVLAPLEDRVLRLVVEARRRRAEADLAVARKALDDGRAETLMDHCARVVGSSGAIPSPDGPRLRAEALKLVERLAARRGVVVAPVQGRFFLGTERDYEAKVVPRLAAALQRAGYVPTPSVAAFRDLWNRHAAYQLTVEVLESAGRNYSQSQHRTSQISFDLTLSRRDPPTTVWRTQLYAQTRYPLPNVSAFEESRIGVGTRRDPTIEQKLYRDARASLDERLDQKLAHRDLPAPG